MKVINQIKADLLTWISSRAAGTEEIAMPASQL